MGAILMDATGLHRTVIRLSHEIGERNKGYADVVLVGASNNGNVLAERIRDYIRDTEGYDLPCAGLDGELGFSVDKKIVVLCDDILYTGRNVVSSVDALFALGNPRKIQLLVLVDRGGRELPVRADFVGKNVPTSKSEYIEVSFGEGGAQGGLVITKREDA